MEKELQRLADATGLIIEVCHFPPGIRKLNKIDIRLYCHINRNWQGQPVETFETVVQLPGNTSTREGLKVHAWLDESVYGKSIKVTDSQLAECRIKRNKFPAG